MKGNLALDITVMFVCMIVLGVFLIYFFGPMRTVLDGVQETTDFPDEGTTIIQNTNSSFPSTFDNAGVMFFVLVWLFLIISSYYIGTNPLFFIITFILMIMCFVVLVYLGNFFYGVSSANQETAELFPKLVWMNTHILELGIVVFITSGIALFAKRDNRGGGL